MAVCHDACWPQFYTPQGLANQVAVLVPTLAMFGSVAYRLLLLLFRRRRCSLGEPVVASPGPTTPSSACEQGTPLSLVQGELLPWRLFFCGHELCPPPVLDVVARCLLPPPSLHSRLHVAATRHYASALLPSLVSAASVRSLDASVHARLQHSLAPRGS